MTEPGGTDDRTVKILSSPLFGFSSTSFLEALMEALPEDGKDRIYPCVRDLVENALSLDRFSPGAPAPNRQEITQYLAAWCRHAGLSQTDCEEWLTAYCVEMLAPFSRTSKSGIRHSTKSNVRYIYRAGIVFWCERESNRFKAHCVTDCALYARVQAAPDFKQQREMNRNLEADPAKMTTPAFLPVKALYRDQFETALELVRQEIGKGRQNTAIANLLDERGLKTRTGRKWTSGIVAAEISKMKRA